MLEFSMLSRLRYSLLREDCGVCDSGDILLRKHNEHVWEEGNVDFDLINTS